MIELYQHQREGVEFLVKRPSAGLWWEMGCGKSRAALMAANKLFQEGRAGGILILAPTAVCFAWREELAKLAEIEFVEMQYKSDTQGIRIVNPPKRVDRGPLVLIVSYSLLPQKRHVDALSRWCFSGEVILICDESSFLKNRTAKQTKGAAKIGASCAYRWLLTGTPIANSPLDLYGQALVMSNGSGPLKGFENFYHFRSRYAVTQPMRFGGGRVFQQVVGYQNLPELQKKFAPYVSRVEKKDCLDLPEKSYSVREVALSEATWKIYQELKREAMLALPDSDERPEPNAAVRILRLAQITSGHVGGIIEEDLEHEGTGARDVGSEKLDFLTDSILDGELSNERALIVWCRWRRERERLADKLTTIAVTQIYGGQSEKECTMMIEEFQRKCDRPVVLLAQPHAGGFGLTLTAASTAIYLSNDFSFTTRVQSEDRIHRIGQKSACLYLDIVATGPKGQATVDAHILAALREKKSLAELTCSAWKRILGDE